MANDALFVTVAVKLVNLICDKKILTILFKIEVNGNCVSAKVKTVSAKSSILL